MNFRSFRLQIHVYAVYICGGPFRRLQNDAEVFRIFFFDPERCALFHPFAGSKTNLFARSSLFAENGLQSICLTGQRFEIHFETAFPRRFRIDAKFEYESCILRLDRLRYARLALHAQNAF